MIRIDTAKLIELIGDLKHTTAPDPDSGAINGILLHTDRGYGFPGDPGKTDILVGTSTNRVAIGHTYVDCHSQMSTPMLWPLQSALAVVSLYKPALKTNKEHAVEISYDAGNNTVHVQEDADLFGAGTQFSFTGGDLTKWPRHLWAVLDQCGSEPSPGRTMPVLPRSDLPSAALAPFVAVAGGHGGVVEIYRYHQQRPVLVQIGARYRGAAISTHWPDEKTPQAGAGPHGDIYPAELPAVEEQLTVNPESLLEQAADLVITNQMVSLASVMRQLRVGEGKAATLLDQLELLGVIGPGNGGRVRDVLVHTAQLSAVLGKVRAAEQPATEGPDNDSE